MTSSKDDIIHEYAHLYKHGVGAKNPAQYKEIKCVQCHETIGWSPYYPRDLLYCQKCYEPIHSHMKGKGESNQK